MTARVAVLISGSGTNMMALARAMVRDFPARPVLVLSNDPAAAGLAKARAKGIATFVVDHRGRGRADFEAEIDAVLRRAKVDIICLAGFMCILTPGFVAGWQGRMLNIHPALLPKYPGLHTHARAIAAGDRIHGCTVHEVTGDLDAGPILGQARIPVRPGDTAEALAARLLPMEHRLYPAVLRRFATGDRTPVMLG